MGRRRLQGGGGDEEGTAGAGPLAEGGLCVRAGKIPQTHDLLEKKKLKKNQKGEENAYS